MDNFPTTFTDETVPLDETLFNDADVVLLRELIGKGYELHTGLTLAYANEISKMCQQPAIKEYCPNDAGKRFTDRYAAEHWASKGREVFLLLKKDGEKLNLAGYGWTGPETSQQIPGGEITFAPRIGEGSQGQGLSSPYSRLIIAATHALYNVQNFWLETWASNGAAVHVYHKLGFSDVKQEEGERPTLGGGQVKDVRIYMSLPNELL